MQVGGGYDEPTARVLFDGEGFENSGVGGLLFENGGSATGGFFICKPRGGRLPATTALPGLAQVVSVLATTVQRYIPHINGTSSET